MKLVVVIPAYNEEKNIRKTVESVPRKIEGIDEVEVVVVNDGSKDRTAEEVSKTDAYLVSYTPTPWLGV